VEGRGRQRPGTTATAHGPVAWMGLAQRPPGQPGRVRVLTSGSRADRKAWWNSPMLAIVAAVALGACGGDFDCKGERVCVEGRCVEPDAPRAGPSPALKPVPPELASRREMLIQQRPGLVPPIVTLAIGASLGVAVMLLADVPTGVGVGSGLIAAGASWLFAVLWARSRIGDMLDELDVRLH
jgi:hypothetical protein